MASNATTMPTKVPALISTPLIVVSIIFVVLSFVSIVLRYKSRRIAGQSFQSDDYWIVLSWIFSLGLSINAWTFGTITGFDYYKINPVIGVQDSLKCLLIASSLVQLPLAAVKISILLFYKRIFVTPKFRTAVWITIPFIFAWGIIFFIIVLLQSDPVAASWTPGLGHLRWDSTAIGLAQVGSSVALDVIILCFPLPVIFGLHMRTQRKVAVALILWVGGFCCVAAIVRLVLVNQSVRQVEQSLNSIHVQTKQFIFMMVEPNCSIIAACLPCYGPLMGKGRSPESIVRSVRSVLSLRSKHSASQRSQSPRKTCSSDSSIGLKQASRDWYTAQNRGHNFSNVESRREDDFDSYHIDGINVTKAYNVDTVEKDDGQIV